MTRDACSARNVVSRVGASTAPETYAAANRASAALGTDVAAVEAAGGTAPAPAAIAAANVANVAAVEAAGGAAPALAAVAAANVEDVAAVEAAGGGAVSAPAAIAAAMRAAFRRSRRRCFAGPPPMRNTGTKGSK